ncbi:MAG: hypothetical protein HRU70_12545 [Phycisphaeraceae bacterium]|nr:MAG: hypothetical protein HRU70_12545 [Phycisphaeraceae bacterium]
MRALWSARWNLLRLAAALALAAVLAGEVPRRLATLRFAALPDHDWPAEVERLVAEDRLGEAEVVADAALGFAEGPARARLLAAKDAAAKERERWARIAREVGVGALTGRGGSAERLIGALGADFFVVGDVRDLVIQAVEITTGGEPDPVITALSAAGLATTLAPAIDWAPSVLKSARRSGALSPGLASHVTDAARRGRWGDLASLCDHVASLSRSLSPGGATRALRLCETPADAARLAALSSKNPGASAMLLHAAPDRAGELVRTGTVAGAKVGDDAVLAAAGKGRRGVEWTASPTARAMLRPHPILGLAKGLWKGNAGELIDRTLAALGPRLWWLVPAACAWALIEAILLVGRLGAKSPGPIPSPGRPSGGRR